MTNVAITVEIKATPIAQAIIDNVKGAIAKSITGVSFASIKNYTSKSSGEIANHLFNLGVDLSTAKQKDIKMLQELDLTTFATKTDLPTLEIARTELLNSLINPSVARSKGQTNAYENITNGIRVHKESGAVHIYGMFVSKEVIKKGEYKSVNSKPKTIAKKELQKLMKSTKFRTFIVNNIETLNLNKESLEIN